MLPRQHRLVKRSDFSRVYKGGKAFFSHLTKLRYIQNGSSVTRVGFVVSTKVHKKAAVRNLLKRRYREAFKTFLPLLKPGLDIVVTAQKTALDKSYAELEQSLRSVLQRAKLFI